MDVLNLGEKMSCYVLFHKSLHPWKLPTLLLEYISNIYLIQVSQLGPRSCLGQPQ